MSKRLKAIFITEVKVQDPDSGAKMTVGIYKDPESRGLFGIEDMFLEQIERDVRSPYNEHTILICNKR